MLLVAGFYFMGGERGWVRRFVNFMFRIFFLDGWVSLIVWGTGALLVWGFYINGMLPILRGW